MKIYILLQKINYQKARYVIINKKIEILDKAL